jgi:adenylate kinase
MIREHIKAHDAIGQKAEDIVKHGQLIPDEITNEMVHQRLLESDAKHSFLLDGYPRDVFQAEFITKEVSFSGVIVMTLTDELIMERLLARGRADDIPETIKDRIKLYKETTQPVLDFLEEKNIPFIRVNGDYNIDTDVENIVCEIVDWQKEC